jgi:glycosyltransferase involved in cell wall biosynthesis
MATIEKQLDAVRIYMKSVDDNEAEVLIFDQGSSDGTPEFLRQCQKNLPHGTIMLSKNNLGQCVSRNKLCQAARGDYVLFLDGDVVPIPGSIEAMLDVLVSNDAQWPGVYYDVHGDIYDEAGATPVELPITMADMSTSPVPMFHYAVYDRGFLNAHPLPEFYPFDGPGWGVEEEMCGLTAPGTVYGVSYLVYPNLNKRPERRKPGLNLRNKHGRFVRSCS